MTDAQRAIHRLDGFVLMGYRISVSLARFNPRSKFWKKASFKSQQENGSEFVTKELNTRVVHGVQTIVDGISDKAILERLCSSVIVSTFKPYKVETLFEFLEGKGLIDFDVHQISGNQYLLDFDREEMVSQCLKWEWGWLSEIFSDIHRWHKDFSPGNRVTWVAIQGVPLFAWNNFTFNNLLNRWGEILFLEDEQVDVGTEKVAIPETFGFPVEGERLEKAGASFPMRVVKNIAVETLNVEASTEADLVCCADRSFNTGQNRSAHRLDFFEVSLLWGGGVTSFGTCINGINLTSRFKIDCAKDHNSRMVSDGLHNSGQFQKLVANVHGFGGCVSVQNPIVSNEETVNLSLSTPLEIERYDPTIEFWKRGDVVGAQPVLSSRALEDVRLMGLLDAVPGEECEIVQCDTTCPTWAESIDQVMNSMYTRLVNGSLDLEEVSSQINKVPELPSRSRKKETFALGKKVGFHFIGDEEEVVNDLVNLEHQIQD
ncbi:hypothetical protein V6N12_061911 [Hibiscus sabdariffa]|uniref:DUF4283 domain-containing protein n=1 Tax=Hibiscus sabdariffa TaxID=183260 RepID=A0ABR2DYF9_9ROSI